MAVPYEEFVNALAGTKNAEELTKAYELAEAQRVSRELAYREDTTNREAHAAYARAIDRKIMLFAALSERGIKPPDPEKEILARQVEQLERVPDGEPRLTVAFGTDHETRPEEVHSRIEEVL